MSLILVRISKQEGNTRWTEGGVNGKKIADIEGKQVEAMSFKIGC